MNPIHCQTDGDHPVIAETPSLPSAECAPLGDDDNEGVADPLDNCTDLANADQSNTVGDDEGQDFDPLDAADSEEDPDNDSFTNLQEFRGQSAPLYPESFPITGHSMPWLPLLLEQ